MRYTLTSLLSICSLLVFILNTTLIPYQEEESITSVNAILPTILEKETGAPVQILDCGERDSLALVALYTATNGAEWTTPWNLSAPMSTWFGVTLNEGGCVRYLDFDPIPNDEVIDPAPNNLTGILPPEIGDLQDLERLNLFQNNIEGSIPTEIGQLTKLRALVLQDNKLRGEIPATIGNLNNLYFINLSYNQLSGTLPDALYDLTKLRYIVFNGNQIGGTIKGEIKNLQDLIILSIIRNNLSGSIPEEIGLLKNLEQIHLSDNQLTGRIPATIGQLSKLKLLYLWRNILSEELPAALGNLSNLEKLDVADNSFSGNIPDTLGALANLTYLSLSYNDLTGTIPASLADLENLEAILLNNNYLSGCFPETFKTFCTMEVYEPAIAQGYNFSDNPQLPWQGDFEAFCSGITQVEAPCNAGGNALNGTITANCACQGIQIGACRERDSLALIALYNATNGVDWDSTWNLSAPLSTWFGVFLNEEGCVQQLDFSNAPDNPVDVNKRAKNNLTGILPPEIGNLLDLERLNLNTNRLTGTVPAELSKLKKIKELRLYNNLFTGEIPPELGQLSTLKVLYLWTNQLTGKIPKELGNLQQIERLSFGINELSGTIPYSIGSLSKLIYLSLQKNDLTGTIPPNLGQLKNIESIRLNDNDLSGCFPEDLKILCNLGGEYADSSHSEGYAFFGNPQLPWAGDFQPFCSGENQFEFCEECTPVSYNYTGNMCSSEEVIINGNRYNRDRLSGTEILARAATNGCDSIINVSLRLMEAAQQEVVTTICHGEYYENYKETGLYRDTFMAINGCDSIRILQLTKFPRLKTELDRAIICPGESYRGRSELGAYIDVFPSVVTGCDSIITFQVAIDECLVSAVPTPSFSKQITISPTLVSDYFKIEWTGQNLVHFTIFDSIGRRIQQQTILNSLQEVHTFTWDAGVYLVVFQSEEGQFLKRVVVK